jgi:hypothetical protein
MKGTIAFSGLRPKHTVERAMISELERWISRETSPWSAEPCSYSVHLTSEGDLPFYCCRVEVVIGDCRWRANESGKSPLSALANTLKRMRVCAGNPPRAARIREHAVVA